MWVAVLFTLLLTYVVYYCCFKPYNYWKNRGIGYEVPLPLVGNFGGTVYKRKHPVEIYHYLYNKFPGKRYVGIYIFFKPALLLRDLDLIKKICVDESDHFLDRVKIFDKHFDTVIGNSLPNLKGEEWKETRSILNPVFAAGQIKNIFGLISDCADTFSKYFDKEDKDLVVEIQLSDVFSRYECDVLSRICFGVTTNSLEDRDNDFFRAYKKIKSFGSFEKLKLSLIQLCPLLAKILRIKVFPTSKTDFYKKMVAECLRKCESESNVRGCVLNYIVEAKKGNLKCERVKPKDGRRVEFADGEKVETVNSAETQKAEWKTDELVAHVLMFLNSHTGIETILSTISFLAYELALNPSVQVKLQEEIDNVQNSTDNNVTYEAIYQMKYLDCVISESLRKWPPVYQTDRECVKNFFEVEFAIPDDEKIVIEKNTAVIVPIMAIHRDPNHFPQPEKFSPERFNEENRDKIVPGSYIPFGLGPRNCIGSQLAILEVKLLFFHLLSKFDLVPTANTKTRVEMGPNRFDINGAIKTFLGLKPRKVTSL